MIGERISPILEEIEQTLWEFEAQNLGKPNYSDEGFRAALKVFMSAVMDRLWDLQSGEEMEQRDRENMALKLGEDLRRIIKTYTNIDTYDLYK